MPLFRRSDGTPVRDESPLRRIMPYAVRSRTEAAIYHSERYDLTRVEPWLEARRTADLAPGFFDLFMWAFAQSLYRFPDLNRFVIGRSLYDRHGVSLSFAAKNRKDPASAYKLIKLAAPEGEPFAEFVRRVAEAVAGLRAGREQPQDRELALAMRVPGPLLDLVMRLIAFADRHNLLPASMIEPDPMYASAFVTNLGSVGLDHTYHHLNELGTASMFIAIGVQKRAVFVGEGDHVEVRPAVDVRFSVDERIADGAYTQAALTALRRRIERPDDPPPDG